MIIAEHGSQEIGEKIKNPLNSIFNKLEGEGNFNIVAEEFEFMFKFLNEIEDWDRPNIQSSKPKNVVIDGKLYTPQIGG